jgi:hypothetical protein
MIGFHSSSWLSKIPLWYDVLLLFFQIWWPYTERWGNVQFHTAGHQWSLDWNQGISKCMLLMVMYLPLSLGVL